MLEEYNACDCALHLATVRAQSLTDLDTQSLSTFQIQTRVGEQGFPDLFSSSYQIQISLLSGRTMLQWVCAMDLVQDLSRDLELRLGISSSL